MLRKSDSFRPTSLKIEGSGDFKNAFNIIRTIVTLILRQRCISGVLSALIVYYL